jgi:hypothetical protein
VILVNCVISSREVDPSGIFGGHGLSEIWHKAALMVIDCRWTGPKSMGLTDPSSPNLSIPDCLSYHAKAIGSRPYLS